MNGEQIPKEMMKLWKTSWETYLKAMNSLQEQGEKMMELMLEQSDSLRDEFKKMVKESSQNLKEVQKTYLKAVEDNISKIEEMLGKE